MRLTNPFCKHVYNANINNFCTCFLVFIYIEKALAVRVFLFLLNLQKSRKAEEIRSFKDTLDDRFNRLTAVFETRIFSIKTILSTAQSDMIALADRVSVCESKLFTFEGQAQASSTDYFYLTWLSDCSSQHQHSYLSQRSWRHAWGETARRQESKHCHQWPGCRPKQTWLWSGNWFVYWYRIYRTLHQD